VPGSACARFPPLPFAVFCGLDVGKSEQDACAVDASLSSCLCKLIYKKGQLF
jgi:hypothetical protein